MKAQKQTPEVFCNKRCSYYKFRKIHRKTPVSESFFYKVAGWPVTLIKKRLWHRCFPMTFAKFLRTPISQNTSERLLLKIKNITGVQKIQFALHIFNQMQNTTRQIQSYKLGWFAFLFIKLSVCEFTCLISKIFSGKTFILFQSY